MYGFIVKRTMDIIGALVILILTMPISLSVLLLLLISHRTRPIYFQQRPGKNGVLFEILKFKTMTDALDSTGKLLPDSDRLTGVGNRIRRLSLDELPQLLNVLRGDMSLIGPRPLLPEYLPLYNEEQKRRHEVKPGITGWAQVNGRNAISWQEKFKLDVWYVDNISFMLDFKILMLTIKKVLMRSGISSEKGPTMERFVGNMN